MNIIGHIVWKNNTQKEKFIAFFDWLLQSSYVKSGVRRLVRRACNSVALPHVPHNAACYEMTDSTEYDHSRACV